MNHTQANTKQKNTIIYTKTDEAPALATYSLLPIIRAFAKTADIDVQLKDISLAGRIIAQFPECLTAEQQQEDALALLGEMTQDPQANIIKLPNISASVPQLLAAIKELQQKGYALPEYPQEPKNDAEASIKSRYGKVLGSAVNPVLREGNSDRRVAQAVKNYAKTHPHRMGAWSADSKSFVAHMQDGDFYGSEQSHICDRDQKVTIELHTAHDVKTLKQDLALLKDEVIDASVMQAKALNAFFTETIQQAKEKGLLFSLHMKATMMKVSDPVIFGYGVQAFFENIFNQFAEPLEQAGVNVNNGLGDLYAKLTKLPEATQQAIKDAIAEVYAQGPGLAMVDSDKGITNLHVPSDVIIDASMPAAIRSSGKMWNAQGELQDTIFTIPDRSYAKVYQTTIEFCKQHGAFDPTTMGNVANVGLMAKKAEEYGSHDKTFIISEPGTVKVVAEDGQVIFEHTVASGDIWRMCQTKDVAIRDWVKLGVNRARLSGSPAIFWLDEHRPHDANLIKKVDAYLKQEEIEGLSLSILSPAEATQRTCEMIKAGEDVIAVTGNVLRDYLTDLFPILELGTSAKMLSIVPLLAGGGLFETGAGGSAPKHVQQFVSENHLRWDSLGEFLALAVSLEDLAIKTKNGRIKVLAEGLHAANSAFLANNKSPLRKAGELDNRGSHFYLAMYWAQALASQEEDTELKAIFGHVAAALEEKETAIVNELNEAQGVTVDLQGYYQPNDELGYQVMRPSTLFNQVIDELMTH